jgi:uncharacterized membrane protein
MRVKTQILVAAPIGKVFTVIADPERALHFMSGITRWEVAGDKPQGCGARYRMLLRVGSAEIGGLIEVVEYDPPRELAWTSVTGIDQRGRFRLRADGPDRTRVEMRLSYGVAGGGPAAWLAEMIGARTVSRHLNDTLRGLKRLVEYEGMRERAAERRAARTAA